MRNNQPVTQTELKVPDDQTLISVTDLKGRITYANKAFISMSGFLEEELLGQAHNLVRHPDMPEEAFRDLWDTIEAGLPWTGLVKNRRKNGDFYWVRANATPMRAGERIVGYLSVRTKPTDAEIQGAEKLYATMRQEAASGRLVHKVHRSRVIKAGAIPSFIRLLTPGMRGQLFWLAFWPAAIPLFLQALDLPLWACLIGGFITFVAAATWIWRMVGYPLHEVIKQANTLAAGDLSRNLESHFTGPIGQLQQALNQMCLNVRTVVRDIQHEVGNLRGGTQEIAMGNSDMSNRVESQASSLEETAASMEEINGTVKQTTEAAGQGATLANDTLSVAQRSHESVQEVTDAMKGIAESSRRIGDIIQTIEGVAFQTNILALNAAVEAARAGEAGRGFAVVASEVRALAQRTTGAAKEIRTLIEESRLRVEDGYKRATDARERVDESMESVNRMTSMLDSIKLATQEQLVGTSQIAEALQHMDGITQQNAAMVEELAAASKALNDQVDSVHNTIRVFRLFPNDKTLAEDDAVELRKESKASGQLRDDDIDFDKIIAAHQQWRVTLRNNALKKKKMDAETLRRDDCCALGKWIYGGGGKRWGTVPVFKDLVQYHKAFHHEAGKVADAINQGQEKRAQDMMENGTPFVEAGHSVTQTIRSLRAVTEGDQASPAAPMPSAAANRPSPKLAAPRTTTAAAAPKRAASPSPAASGAAKLASAPVRVSAPAAPSASSDEWETF